MSELKLQLMHGLSHVTSRIAQFSLISLFYLILLIVLYCIVLFIRLFIYSAVAASMLINLQFN